MQDRRKIFIIVTLALCFITAFIYLFFPLGVGMQDSGALSHVEKGLGIQKAGSTFENGNHTELKYKVLEAGKDTQAYNGASADYINPMVTVAKSMEKNLDLRVLGGFYLILMLLAVYLILSHVKFKKLWQDILLCALLYFVFFDVAYLVYFNSLYTEAGFLVFLVLACAFYCKMAFSKTPQKPTLVFYYICAFMLCGMKPNMAFLGILFALMGLRLLPLRKGYIFRGINLVLALVIAIVPFFEFDDITPESRKYDLYNSVFYGILKDNEDIPKALEDLGLSQSLATYAGTAGFNIDIDAPELQTQFFEKVGYGDVVKYYLTNPGVLLDKCKIAANNAFENRPRYLGNYTIESGKDPKELAEGFSLYSSIKRRLFPAKSGFVFIFAVLMAIGAIYLRKKTQQAGAKAFCDFTVLLSLLSLLIFPVALFTYGESELSRHMNIYAMVFDVLFVIAVCGITVIVTERRNSLKEKFGVEQ